MSDLEQRIRAKCIEDGDCLVWQGASCHGTHPNMRIDGKIVYVRKAWHELKRGPLPKGKIAAHACETRNCICHTEALTFSEIQRRVGAKGLYSRPERAAKIAATKRAQVGKWSMEIAREIRNGDLPIAYYAEKHGMDPAVAARIRRGEAWKEYESNPWRGLGAR